MCFSVLLLAAADGPPSDPTSYAAMGWIITGIFGIVGLANQGMALWDRLFPRATPPAHELYATKTEVAKLGAEHEEEMKRIEHRFEQWLEQQSQQHKESMTEMRAWRTELGKWQQGIENVVGRIDTKATIALDGKHPRK